MSEKNQSIVQIKTTTARKPLEGAVQKVLNQIIILKPAADEPVTLTFGDIESVTTKRQSAFQNVCRGVLNVLGRMFSVEKR